jgi:hypothetical protein
MIDARENYWSAGLPLVDDDAGSASILTEPQLPYDPTTPQNGVYLIPQCQPVPPAQPPTPQLILLLDVDTARLSPAQLADPYSFTVGEQIPLMAVVGADGLLDITDPVRIELTVPRGLRPQGMTIQGEDQSALNRLFSLLVALLELISPDLSGLVNDILGIGVTPDTVTFTYDIADGVRVGQPFPITLDVVGRVGGSFVISGEAFILPDAFGSPDTGEAANAARTFTPASGALSQNASVQLQVNPLSNAVDCDDLPRTVLVEQLATSYRFVIQESGLIDENEVRASCRALINTANALHMFALMVEGGGSYQSSADAFITIMLGSADGSITYSNTTDTTQVGASNCKTGPTTIVCGAQNVLSEYTMTHELGHVFLYRSAFSASIPDMPLPTCIRPTFNACMEVPIFEDGNEASLGSRDSFVFGNRGFRLRREQVTAQLNRLDITDVDAEQFGPYQDILPGSEPPQPGDLRTIRSLLDWLRGTRGWGSGAPEIGLCGSASQIVPTDFQQNPCEYITWLALISQQYRDRFSGDQNPAVTEIEEAGADMFLNWVYRSISQNDSTDIDYQGFLNVDWSDCTDASECADAIAALPNSDGPGDDRWIWMNLGMAEFFVYYGW